MGKASARKCYLLEKTQITTTAGHGGWIMHKKNRSLKSTDKPQIPLRPQIPHSQLTFFRADGELQISLTRDPSSFSSCQKL